MPNQVLVVEDDESVRGLVCDALNLAHYDTLSAVDGLEALEVQRKRPSDLIVADVTMPGLDGFKLAERLRGNGDTTPIIFLTARNAKPDVSKGFLVGADDYIFKPFGIEELVLRVAAVLRRTSKGSESVQVLSVGPVTVNLEKARVEVSGETIPLSPTEFRLLVTLIENKNKVVSRKFLLDAVWDMGFSESASVVDTYISYLRRKLHSSKFQGIKTVRGFGFEISDK